MFERVFVEKNIVELESCQKILRTYKASPIIIDSYQQVFSKVRKPYLLKRKSLDLFLAEKKEELLRPAPDAYGAMTGKHYYFSHSYNCIFECEYCYLQDSFATPDIVLFMNHQDIIAEIQKTIIDHPPGEEVWFHAGEYSDSLALSGLTSEWGMYFEAFKKFENAKLELRTKSVSIKGLLKLQPNKNVIVSFSLSPKETAQSIDRKTPGTPSRLKAMRKLHEHGYKVAVHLDPIVYQPGLVRKYEQLANEIIESVGLQVEYISVGVVRFPPHLYKEVEQNYPRSVILRQPFVKAADGMRKYPQLLKNRMLRDVRSVFEGRGFPSSIIYICMDEEL